MNTNTNTTEALRRISKARALTSRDVFYWAKVSEALRPVPAPGLGTFAVTKDMVLLFDPDVAATQWDAEQVRFAFEHEVYHVALCHSDRAEKILEAEGSTFDAHLWNICADFECNRIARARGRKVIDGVAFAEDYDLPATIVAEVAYRTLRDKQEQDQQQGGDDQQQGGDDQQQGDDQQDGDQQGDGEGKAKDGGKLGHGKCGSCSGGDKAQGEDDVPDEVKAGKLERDAVEREVAQAIVDAAAKDPGSVPGEVLLRAQQRLAPSKTPWQNILRRHVRRALNQRNGYTEQTYARQSRRQSMHGAGAGSIVLPTTYDPQVEVAVVVDTSGSMGQQEMQAALAEVDGILRAARSAIRVLSCDKQVHLQGKVTRVAEAAKLLRGGGGTDFRPAFEALAKHRPGLTIVVTDGYGPAPKDAPRWTDTIWLLVGDYTTKPCEWGEFIEAK